MMSELTRCTLLLLFCLATFTTTIRAPAAPDFMLMATITVPDPLMESTTPNTANLCKDPPQIPFGQLKDEFLRINEFTTNSKVTYMCQPGYIRVPGTKPTITCLDDNTWSSLEIFCTRKSCGNPGEVENADMQAENFLFGSKVTYVCFQGYRMISKRNYRECLADGKWSNFLPKCEVLSCPPPPSITNGYFNPEKDEYYYLDSVTYQCNKRLARIGEEFLSCNENGEWSSNAPECREVVCLDPFVQRARKLSGITGPYYLNSAVRFECSSGYLLNGSDIVKCNLNSQWEPELPNCIGFCRFSPYLFPELEVLTKETRFIDGTTLKFECKEGYKLEPGVKDTITCEGTKWSTNKPCTPVECPEPNVPRARKMPRSVGPYFFNSVVRFVCAAGYVLNGSDIVKCNQNKQWEPELPKCIGFCVFAPYLFPELEVLTNETRFIEGTALKFECKVGYERNPDAKDTITCEGIKWSTDKSCTPISCGNPGSIPNGNMRIGNFLFGSTIYYTCNSGYRMRSATFRKCTSNGTWTLPIPVCEGVPCGHPGNSENAEFEAKDFLFGSEAIYKCKKGYKMISHENSRKCGENGIWIGKIPVCEVETCPPPERLMNGSYGPEKEKYNYKESVTYECNKLNLVGEHSVTCTEDGEWTSGAPECKAVCKSPPELKYGVLDEVFTHQKFFNIHTQVQYKCRPGFVPLSDLNSTITCLDDLRWSEPDIFCAPISCGEPREIDHGKMEYKNFFFGSTVNYTCVPGYTMISRRNYRECQADGTWSGTAPVCKESVCDKIWELQEEARTCTSTPDEWIKYLQVQYLYLQIENLKLDILIKKKELEII
ncbi:zona pellucida sperm-binding protein 3 receptor-like isoform X2 [Mixophyes fleayi]|uniref:zona pellucida sperm-binding protein 3 receptor-like isoform X2 n=1 Tax=Mixophyes fleayi TaxID=3061075 RepID=UPI003F4DBD0F